MTDDVKLNKFLSEIKREADQQRKQLEAETESQINSEMSQAEKEISAEFSANTVRRVALAQSDVRRSFARRQFEMRGKLLIRRDELCNGLFEQASERIREFTDSDRYSDYIFGSVKEAAKRLDLCTCTAYLRECDMHFAQKLTDMTDMTVKADAGIILGGIKIVSGDGKLSLNNTFDARLEAERESFRRRCGLTII